MIITKSTDWGSKSFILEDAECPMYSGVTFGAEANGVVVAGDNDFLVGVVDNSTALLQDAVSDSGNQSGRPITVKLQGIAAVLASGAVTFGDEIISAAGGKVKKLPTAAGTYNVVGRAMTSAADGKIVYFERTPYTVVVPA